jgi:hypothetical protein
MNVQMNLEETHDYIQWLVGRYNNELKKLPNPKAVGTASDQAAASAGTNERK